LLSTLGTGEERQPWEKPYCILHTLQKEKLKMEKMKKQKNVGITRIKKKEEEDEMEGSDEDFLSEVIDQVISEEKKDRGHVDKQDGKDDRGYGKEKILSTCVYVFFSFLNCKSVFFSFFSLLLLAIHHVVVGWKLSC
jgi:hypothetical protein